MRKHLTNQFEYPIQIIYFDEKDIEKLGGWPLTRNIYGYLAEKLAALKVKIISFHVYWGKRSEPMDENDLFLKSVLHKHKNIIGSFYFENLENYSEKEKTIPEIQWNLKDRPKNLLKASGIKSPDENFLKGKAQFGFVNLLTTKEGIIEDAALLIKCGNAIYPSFSNLIAQNYKNSFIHSATSNIKINFTVDAKHLPLIPVREIIQPEISDSLKRKLKNSIVIIGIISSQLGFEKPTPIDPSMPVAGIHAQIIDNLLTDKYLKTFPNWIYLIIFLLISTFVKIDNFRNTLYFFLTGSILFTITGIVLWKFHIIFQLYAYVTTLILFLLISIINIIFLHKKRYMEEIERRKKLELRFTKNVQSAAKLEQEYLKLRQKYQNEIENLREELTFISEKEAELIQKDYPGIVCSSKSPMIKILSELARIGATDEPVLITGESGTGKELIAKLIHQKSKRRAHQFIAVNCGALTESILESELFGHEKGAFTGADREKAGFFEAAEKGTIFLDEITETPFSFQAKLLRILQEGTFFRVGSTQNRKSNCRVIAATNKDIEKLTKEGKFRPDLYFRLNVLPVHLPPLRERKEDISLLLSHFLNGKDIKISSGANQILLSYHWHGNIRELQNISSRIKIIEDGTIISPDWIKKQLSFDKKNRHDPFDEKILSLYREMKFRNNANTKIAEILGNFHRSTITEYLKGMTFQFFVEENYQLDKTVRRFNPQSNPQLDARIENRIQKYLNNLIKKLDINLSEEVNLNKFQTHIRKLPKKYHPAAINTAKSFLQRVWKF